ncbi:MAG: tetratricopeptide repeat-containing protein [Steroidobacteraceae bacterium]
MNAVVNPVPQKTCFVVMGFGEKTDFQTQRTLDLDKTYRNIIRPAVEAAGLKCIRADDVLHSGNIDIQMYELLLNADVVIADLSTSNANAIYELGVRHALKPATTIILAESQFKYPFDLSHIVIRSYEHLGKGIDYDEALRMREVLTTAIKALADGAQPDSPVYQHLNSLTPPSRQKAVVQGAKAETAKVVDAAVAAVDEQPASPKAAANVADDLANSALLDAARAARAAEQFAVAKVLLQKLKERRPKDPYVIQQLALVTYKSKQPTVADALFEAQKILQELDPLSSSDPETLGLWGAIHKRLWEVKSDRKYLDESLRAYERGFYLRNDSYTGINYAFLLNVRASVTPPEDRAFAIADYITARRVRQQVIEGCVAALQGGGIKDDKGNIDPAETFWASATLIEGYVGIGDDQKGSELIAALAALQPETWMMSSLQTQLASLRKLLEQQAALVRF